MDNMLKGFRIIMAFLIAVFSNLWGILICIDNLWNIWLCIPFGLGFFILIYGFFWLCMFSADKITNAFAKVYQEKVVPRTQQAAIENWAKCNHGDLQEKCQTTYAKYNDVINQSGVRWQSHQDSPPIGNKFKEENPPVIPINPEEKVNIGWNRNIIF